MRETSQRQRLTAYLQDSYETPPEHLWENYPSYAVFRHPLTRKWYALFAGVPANKLGLPGDGPVDILNLKCGPLMLGALLEEPGFFPAYHMSKSSWVTVLLDGTVADEKIASLLELSYQAVAPKMKKKSK